MEFRDPIKVGYVEVGGKGADVTDDDVTDSDTGKGAGSDETSDWDVGGRADSGGTGTEEGGG